MLGLGVGLTLGIQAGVRGGLFWPPVAAGPDPLAAVSKDSQSGRYVPANSTEWSVTLAVAGLVGGNPSDLWLCQESAGSLADSIGSTTLTVAGSPTYANAVTGWTRKSVNITATTVQAFSGASGSVPSAGAGSVAWLGYVMTTSTPGGQRQVLTLTNNATGLRVDHQASNKLTLACGGSAATSVNSYTSANVYPLLVVYNRTASSVAMYTDQEQLAGTYTSVGEGAKGFGAVVANGDAGSRYLYAAAFAGGAAELTAGNARSLLQTLGWSVSW